MPQPGVGQGPERLPAWGMDGSGGTREGPTPWTAGSLYTLLSSLGTSSGDSRWFLPELTSWAVPQASQKPF